MSRKVLAKWRESESESERKKEEKVRDGHGHVTLPGCTLQRPFTPFAADRDKVGVGDKGLSWSLNRVLGAQSGGERPRRRQRGQICGRPGSV